MQVLFTSCLASFTDFLLQSLTLSTGDQIKCTVFFDKINISLGWTLFETFWITVYMYTTTKYNKGLVVCRHFKAKMIHIISLNSQLSILLLLISSLTHTLTHTRAWYKWVDGETGCTVERGVASPAQPSLIHTMWVSPVTPALWVWWMQHICPPEPQRLRLGGPCAWK